MRRLVGPMVALTVLVACGGSSNTTQTAATKTGRTLAGTITIQKDVGTVFKIGDECKGFGGYEDINDGAQVVVKDQGGKILAVGSVEKGAAIDSGRTTLAFYVVWCRFRFAVPNIPERPFYTVEVAHRGAMTYSRIDLDSKGWNLDLTLG